MPLKTWLVLFSCCAYACAADLTGSWVAQQTSPGGRVRETQFNLQQQGNSITGSILTLAGEQKIQNGKIDGDTLSFEVEMSFGGQPRRITYAGKIEGEALKLRVVMPLPPGVGGGSPAGAPSGPAGPPRGPGQPGPGAGGMRGPSEIVAKRGASPQIQRQIELDARRPKTVLPDMKPLPPNGLAKTPPMGWNSWNRFHAGISDQLIRETADALVSSGLKDAGYVYLVIDDGWIEGRNEDGTPKPNSRFPDMKALAAYVHGKGLKFGIYTSPGPRTCQQLEGSLGYEAIDARTYAAWGVDYVKYDWCGAARVFQDSDMPRVYLLFGQELRKTGRPIVYSLCQYGRFKVQEWGASAGGNLWRTTGDIRAAWDSVARIGFGQAGLEPYAGPGHWNDPDMLEVGNEGLSMDENRSHMSLWAILAAPLMAGNDVRNMSKEIVEVLTNREVLAINQDPAGKQGNRISRDDKTEIWARPLEKGDKAIGVFNLAAEPREIKLPWTALQLAKAPRSARDLWAHRELPKAPEFAASVPAHGVVMLRVKP